MGLRKLLFVVITSLALESCVADYDSNGKNLSWIYDIKNSATTQNQTYRLDTDTGAFRYHFDVSAVDSYKFETMSNDAITMGCYGWKDMDNRWHGTNYVADSHGRRDVRNISKPVDVYPTENEHTTRTFLDNLPQCLAFALDTPPLMVYVFTNHPPTKPPPAGANHNDHIPHSSEQIHKVHTGKVPAYSGTPTTGPNQLQYGTKSPQIDVKAQGSTKGPSTIDFNRTTKPSSYSKSRPSGRPDAKPQLTDDLIAEVTSLAPTLASHRTVKGRQDLSRGSRKYATKLPVSVTSSGLTGEISDPEPSSVSVHAAIPIESEFLKPVPIAPLESDIPEFPSSATPAGPLPIGPFGESTLQPGSDLKTDDFTFTPSPVSSPGPFKLGTPSIGTSLASTPTTAERPDATAGSPTVVSKIVAGSTSSATPIRPVPSEGTPTLATKLDTKSTSSATPPGSTPSAEGLPEKSFLNIFDTILGKNTFESTQDPTPSFEGTTEQSYETTKFGQTSVGNIPTAASPLDLLKPGQSVTSIYGISTPRPISKIPSSLSEHPASPRPISKTPTTSSEPTKGPGSDLKTDIFTFSPAAPTPTPATRPDTSRVVLTTSSTTSGGGVTGTVPVPIESEGTGRPFERTKSQPDSEIVDLPTLPTTGPTVSGRPDSPSDLKNRPTDASKLETPSGYTITSFADRVPATAPAATKPTFTADPGSSKTLPTSQFGITSPSQPTFPTQPKSNQVHDGTTIKSDPGSQLDLVTNKEPGTTIPTLGLSSPPFIGTTSRPVSDLHIDVSSFAPVSATPSGPSKPGSHITSRPDISPGTRVTTSFENPLPSRDPGSRFPIDVTLFSPHKPSDLTESTSLTGITSGPTVPTFDKELHLSSLLPSGSTPSTKGGHREYTSFTTRYDKPAEYGPTTPSGQVRTVTPGYLPPLTGEGPTCSCVCPRG